KSFKAKEIVSVLMESAFYFDLSPEERLCLVRYLLSVGQSSAEAG
ncbi:MAG TPA: hypothetical protein ENH50_10240, partial [Nitrospirae bacterium]|nr:hypothetical protein [Nitrospirota bacterium]